MTIYYDSFTGLVPCEVLAKVKSDSHDLTGSYDALIKLDATLGPYKAGETLTVASWQVVEKVGKLVRSAVLTC